MAKKNEDPAAPGLRTQLENLERKAILEVLNATAWNRTRAGRILGYTLRQMRYHMVRLGIKPTLIVTGDEDIPAWPIPQAPDQPAPPPPPDPVSPTWALIGSLQLGFFEGKAIDAIAAWHAGGDVEQLRAARACIDHLIAGTTKK